MTELVAPPSDPKVLLVDDNRPMRILVRAMLRELGISQCHETTSADEALALLPIIEPHLIITELALPGADGLELVRRIRADESDSIASVAIVMASGHAERRRVRAALEAGVNTFLAKPLSAKSLAQHVGYALHDPRPFVRNPGYYGPERRALADDSGMDHPSCLTEAKR